MRLHRFISDFDLSQNTLEIKDVELINQLSKVLRLKTNDQLILSDGQTNEVIAQIKDIGKKSITVNILKKYKNQNEAERKVFLYCAILKRENFELVVQKATEIGVQEIVPIITERTIKTGLHMDRLRKIIKEAAEQSGRGMVPRLHQAMDFKNVLEHAKLNDLNVIFQPEAELFFGMPCAGGRAEQSKFSAENYVCIPESKSTVGVFIGPEGGWSENEVKFAKEHKFEIASLGKLTLRAETAAIVASFIAISSTIYSHRSDIV